VEGAVHETGSIAWGQRGAQGDRHERLRRAAGVPEVDARGRLDVEGGPATVYNFVGWKPSVKRAAAQPAAAAKRQKAAATEDAGKLLRQISLALQKAAKRTVHGERNKPFTSIEVPASAALAAAAFEDPQMKKRTFASAQALLEWLPGLPKTLHPVANSVKTWSMPRESIGLSIWAGSGARGPWARMPRCCSSSGVLGPRELSSL
jgi:hypothetical protein